MRNIAIILAGGTGSRVGGETPKQLLPLQDGRTVLEHAVDAFEQSIPIHEIVIVMHPEWIQETKDIVARNNWRKVTQVIGGGSERWESSWNAISFFLKEDKKDPDTFYWFHDAARPFVSQDILHRVSEALKSHLAVTVAVPVTDTLYKVKGESLKVKGERVVERIPSRSDYMRAQTPQAFHLDILKEAFERALKAGKMIVTDDAGVVHQYLPEQPIYIVPGEEANKKITYKEDL